MSRTRVKICGLMTTDDIAAAIDAGADAIGVVLSPSSRQVSVQDAIDLLQAVPPMLDAIIVTRQPSAELKQDILQFLSPSWWQSDYQDLTGQVMPAGARALPVYREGDAPEEFPSSYVYEGINSGQGQTVDWNVAARIARRGRMILAGGLDPANVADAIRTVRPYAVDVSSGVESRAGVKDPALIRQFVSAVRQAERTL